MKKRLFPILLFVSALAISSCQKCVECTNCPLGFSGDACVDEFDSKADYEQAVADAEAIGCDCKEKLSGK